jgi:hypothetical protein
MIRLGILAWMAGFSFGLGALADQPEPAQPQAPDFHEVYDLVRDHLAGVSEVDLNRTAVQALVAGLAPKVSLVPAETNSGLAGESPVITRATLFEGRIAYLRIARIQQNLPKALLDSVSRVAGTNELNGLILDLRYAKGDDYAAAAATADLFVKTERPLLDWGLGVVQSKEKADAITMPVATLVNRETSGAAEAFAAVLRQAGTSLILGGKTAGQAMIAQEYPLKNGQRLRIASGPVRLGDGSVLSSTGLKPDISVEVSPMAEQSYFADAFRELLKTNSLLAANAQAATNSPAGTNRARRPRFNEAELVRERKLGAVLDNDLENLSAEPEKPIVQDPVLARALDLLKGLNLVRQSRS